MDATPAPYRSDEVIDKARNASGANECSVVGNLCQIEFHPDEKEFDPGNVGVIFYGGALVDPRGYSPLMQNLTEQFGIPVAVPIFVSDLQFTFGVCNSGRLQMAQAAFPTVEHWVFAGHSFGGVGASTDVWSIYQDNTTDNSVIGGLVMIASDIQQTLGCGEIDFSQSDLPMALVSASNDMILNMTRYNANEKWATGNNKTYRLDIKGGNHGGFGSYNYTLRKPILNQTDGPLEIPVESQWSATVSAIYDVIQRSGGKLPNKIVEGKKEQDDDTDVVSTDTGSNGGDDKDVKEEEEIESTEDSEKESSADTGGENDDTSGSVPQKFTKPSVEWMMMLLSVMLYWTFN